MLKLGRVTGSIASLNPDLRIPPQLPKSDTKPVTFWFSISTAWAWQLSNDATNPTTLPHDLLLKQVAAAQTAVKIPFSSTSYTTSSHKNDDKVSRKRNSTKFSKPHKRKRMIVCLVQQQTTQQWESDSLLPLACPRWCQQCHDSAS
jgi:hypothetical protein